MDQIVPYIIENLLEQMSKIGSHDPFEHLKHKLWPKERLGVKLSVWLLTIKSQESLDFLTCRWCATYHWKSLDEGYNFASDRISIGQSYGLPNSQEYLWEFRDSRLGISGQNDIWVLVPWPGAKYTIRGKVVASPKFGPWWVLWICVCSWFVRAPKVL